MNCAELEKIEERIEGIIWLIDELRLRYRVAYLVTYYLLDLLDQIRNDYRVMCLDPY